MKHIKLFEQFINSINEEDTYNDYPAAAKKNAQKAIDWKEEHGRDEVNAGTSVGWARAHQLAKGENLSTDVVKRMAAFNRHRKNATIDSKYKDTPWKDRGYVAWLLWGGDEGVDWAIEKSKEIDAVKESKDFKPHMMYDPKTGKGYKAEKPEDHERMQKLGYVHKLKESVRFGLKAVERIKWYIKTQNLSKEGVIKAMVDDNGYDKKDVERWMNNNYDDVKETSNL